MEFEFDGCVFAYNDEGEGHPIVLTHGAGVDRAMFADQVDYLVDNDFRVITWDQRLHGASRPATQPFTAPQAVADLGALLDHLELERPVLVGQSLGGNVSQAFVRAEPHRAAALVVIDAAWNTGPLTRVERLLVKSAAPSLGMIPSSRLPRMMADASAETPRARAYAEAAFAALPKRDFLDVWRATVDFLDPTPDYVTPIPLLLVRGSSDATGTIATSMPEWAAHEGIDEIVIDGAGHLATMDAPDAVNEALLAFVRRVTVPQL